MGFQVGKIFGFQTVPVRQTEAKQFAPSNVLPVYVNGKANPLQPETRNLDPNAGPVCGKFYCMA